MDNDALYDAVGLAAKERGFADKDITGKDSILEALAVSHTPGHVFAYVLGLERSEIQSGV